MKFVWIPPGEFIAVIIGISYALYSAKAAQEARQEFNKLHH
jgi:hypothetical protein